MAKRQYIIQHDSEEVQGPGSYVKLRTMRWGDVKALRRETAQINEDDSLDEREKSDRQIALSEGIINRAVIAWDWVDDDDTPLPLPSDDSSVIDKLTQAEINFLLAALMGNEQEKKG